MTIKELIKIAKKCDPNARLMIIQEEELECIPEWWDDDIGEYGGVYGEATELYRADLHSHGMYLLAIKSED